MLVFVFILFSRFDAKTFWALAMTHFPLLLSVKFYLDGESPWQKMRLLFFFFFFFFFDSVVIGFKDHKNQLIPWVERCQKKPSTVCKKYTNQQWNKKLKIKELLTEHATIKTEECLNKSYQIMLTISQQNAFFNHNNRPMGENSHGRVSGDDNNRDYANNHVFSVNTHS